jgi:hypothetical protein
MRQLHKVCAGFKPLTCHLALSDSSLPDAPMRVNSTFVRINQGLDFSYYYRCLLGYLHKLRNELGGGTVEGS